MILTLRRVAVVEAGAFGVLMDEKSIPFAVTLERTYKSAAGPWTKLRPGSKMCVSRMYVRGGYRTFEIMEPGHSAILFHRGNVEAHSEGCVLVGDQFAMIGAAAGIGMSTQAFAEFMALAGTVSGFELTIDGVEGAPKPTDWRKHLEG
jgi:hypothetical protein